MNFKTLKQELYKKLGRMSQNDFEDFMSELRRTYYKLHKFNFRRKVE